MRILRPGTRPPWAIAHRGASSSHPENTIAAFGAALEQRCDGIELDVQLSADGVPFVYHDRTLAKIGGGRRRLATLNSAELARQDAGAWFEPRFRGERIPTLRSVLERYARRTTLLVELKVRERHRERGGHEQLALSVAALVRSLRLEERLFVLSFDRDTQRQPLPRGVSMTRHTLRLDLRKLRQRWFDVLEPLLEQLAGIPAPA